MGLQTSKKRTPRFITFPMGEKKHQVHVPSRPLWGKKTAAKHIMNFDTRCDRKFEPEVRKEVLVVLH